MTNTLSKYVSLSSLSCVFHPSPVLSMSNECQPWTYIPVLPTLDFCHTCHNANLGLTYYHVCHNANLGLTYLLCQPWTYCHTCFAKSVDFLMGIVKPMRPDLGFLCCVQCQVSKYQKPDARIRVAHYQSVYDLQMYVILVLKFMCRCNLLKYNVIYT